MNKTPEEIEQSRLRSHITRRFHKACADYALIEDGDHILVALSGGKDSLALCELLGERSKIYVPRFKVSAVHVRMREIEYESDTSYLKEFCELHGVNLIVKETHISKPEDANEKRSHCFLCSWYRRKMLFATAEELGCNKIALGHHKDDIVETLLMNLIFQGSTSTITPKLQMTKFNMQLIRPLCMIEETDLRRYAELMHYQPQRKVCPFEHESNRANMKDLVRQLEALNPNFKESVMHAALRNNHDQEGVVETDIL